MCALPSARPFRAAGARARARASGRKLRLRRLRDAQVLPRLPRGGRAYEFDRRFELPAEDAALVAAAARDERAVRRPRADGGPRRAPRALRERQRGGVGSRARRVGERARGGGAAVAGPPRRKLRAPPPALALSQVRATESAVRDLRKGSPKVSRRWWGFKSPKARARAALRAARAPRTRRLGTKLRSRRSPASRSPSRDTGAVLSALLPRDSRPAHVRRASPRRAASRRG